jgi:rhodanese-related sulfurtransferase
MVMQSSFRADEPLIIGCRSGSRSHAAVELLRRLGFTRLVELKHGFEGARDAFGRHLPGWRDRGLEVELGEPEPELSYAGLRAGRRAPRP